MTTISSNSNLQHQHNGQAQDGSLDLPLHGAPNPSSTAAGTSPGSFARRPDIGGPLMFASPDTPGMPAPSTRTAWDFLPAGWSVQVLEVDPTQPATHSSVHHGSCAPGCPFESSITT